MIDPAASESEIAQLDRRLLLLSPEDNVVVACANLGDGDNVCLDGARVVFLYIIDIIWIIEEACKPSPSPARGIRFSVE